MTNFRIALIWTIAIAMTATGAAQETWIGAEHTQAVKLGTTLPVRDVLPRTPTDVRKLEDWKASKPEYVRNFIGRRQTPIVKAGSLPAGPDPLAHQTRDGGIAVTPLVNINGINQQQSGSGVPDVCGDVSDQYFVQVVNATWIQVFDLGGNKIGNAFRANTIWNQLGFTSAGDPIILYDQQAGRWFLTEFPSSSRVLLAVSDSGDPLGSWSAWAFQTPRFPDYPKYGIWPTAFVLTTNEGGGSIKFYTINREQMLAGEDMIDIQSFTIPRFDDGPSWQTAQPVDWNGMMDVAPGTLPMIMRINDDAYEDSPVDVVEIYEVDVNWNDEDSSVVTQTQIPVSPYDSEFCSVPGGGFSCVPQPNGVGLDGIPYIFMNACHYRNFGTHSSIVGNFTVDVTGANDGGIRWVELRKTGDDPWELYQEGTVGSDDGLNRFMGGIAIDGDGNIGLAYNVSSESKFPSLRFTGRRASDPLGKMSVAEYEFATGTGSFNDDRFGDYASMSVDAQGMFWYTGEYIQANGQWASGIVGFKLTRDSVDLGPRELTSPADSPDLGMELITACVVNQGILPLTTFDIGLITEDDSVIVETVTIDTLFTDSVYCHTFSTPVDLSAFGPHTLLVFTSMPSDSNQINDTCRFTIIRKTTWDASVARVEGVNQVLCDTFTQIAFVLENAGVAELTSANVIWSLNGGVMDTIHWVGSLAENESEAIPIDVNALVAGNNAVVVYSELPNGNPDQGMLNDTLAFNIFSTPGGQRTVLLLFTDGFPAETSWQVLDTSGAIILSGGPYDDATTLYSEEWCLDTSQCYVFVLLDDFGDGVAGDIDGNFQILNGEGVVVASLNDPDFGFSDTTRFCLQSNCALVANVIVKHETMPGAQNGTINVFSQGGISPLQFSIDGGMNYQSGSFFNNLTPGAYTVVVRDALGCFVVREITILDCNMQVMATVTPATGSMNADGAISLSVDGNSGSLTYSLNGGAFQPSPEFQGLLPDTFNIRIKDSVNCTVQIEVIVDFSSAVTPYYVGHLVTVYPNPSAGYFEFTLEGLPDIVELRYDVLSSEGRVVRSGIASNYSGIVKGWFSLKTFPAGEYFVRFRNPRTDRLIPVIKL